MKFGVIGAIFMATALIAPIPAVLWACENYRRWIYEILFFIWAGLIWLLA